MAAISCKATARADRIGSLQSGPRGLNTSARSDQVCYLPDENEAKKRAEEWHRKIEAALAALPEVRAAPALELLARLKKLEREIEDIWDAMPRVVEPPAPPFVEENLERLSALLEEGVKTEEMLDEFLKELKPHPVDRVQI